MSDRIEFLEATRQLLKISLRDLWWRYFAIGGMSTELEVEAILYGALIPTNEDYDFLAIALNEHSVELGGGYIVPYSDDVGRADPST